MSNVQLEEALERFFAARLPDAQAVRILRVKPQSEGFSQETFSVEIEVTRRGRGEDRSYVVKREPVAGLLEPYDLEPEFRVLHALSDAPFPSPPTPWFEPDPSVLERPFYVMERLPGEVPIPASGPTGEPPFSGAEREALGPEIACTLARLHAIDWRRRGFAFLEAPAPGPEAAERELAKWEQRIGRSGLVPGPVVTEAILWLRRRLPETPEITLVHGDYRLGNWLVERNGAGPRLTGVLDWEMVHLGDPLEDVAWCVSPMWRAGTPYASALLPEQEFLKRYGEVAGRSVDADRLRFYAVLSVVKMIAIEMTGIRAFRDGRMRDLRMAIFDHQIPFLHALLAALRGWLPAAALGGS